MKKMITRTLKFMYFFTCFWMMLSIDAQAYIDPSAVTYVIQAVAAVFIAIGALATVFRHKIAAFFKKGKKTEKREIHMTDENEDTKE